MGGGRDRRWGGPPEPTASLPPRGGGGPSRNFGPNKPPKGARRIELRRTAIRKESQPAEGTAQRSDVASKKTRFRDDDDTGIVEETDLTLKEKKSRKTKSKSREESSRGVGESSESYQRARDGRVST
jgi:hypothetical protein